MENIPLKKKNTKKKKENKLKNTTNDIFYILSIL